MREIPFIPHKTWKKRPVALIYYWRRKGWLVDEKKLEDLVRIVHGIDVADILRGQAPLISVKDFAQKYNMSIFSVYKLFRERKIGGAVVGGKVLVLDRPPPKASKQRIDLRRTITKIEEWGLRGMGARPLALIQFPYTAIKTSIHYHNIKKILDFYKEANRLYRIGRSYYILFSRIGIVSKEELISLYPDPSEIIVPSRGDVSWEEVKLVCK